MTADLLHDSKLAYEYYSSHFRELAIAVPLLPKPTIWAGFATEVQVEVKKTSPFRGW